MSAAGPRDSVAGRRRAAARAGHLGDSDTAQGLLDDEDAGVREVALGALRRCDRLPAAVLARLLCDPAPRVRRRAAELAATDPSVGLQGALQDDDPSVVEMAAWAAGERPVDTVELDCLVACCGHGDPLVREAAVAALGALGDPRGRDTVLAALEDRPAIRRRAVLALAAFDGDDVDAALAAAATDRDWQVRDAAVELLAIGRDGANDHGRHA